MPYRQRAAEILDAWRAAERGLESVAKGSPEREWFEAEIRRLRDTYHELIALQAAAHGPPLPPEPASRPESPLPPLSEKPPLTGESSG